MSDAGVIDRIVHFFVVNEGELEKFGHRVILVPAWRVYLFKIFLV